MKKKYNDFLVLYSKWLVSRQLMPEGLNLEALTDAFYQQFIKYGTKVVET